MFTDAAAWERQAGESSRAFAAFVHYRDRGPSRSLDKAWQSAHPQKSHRRRSKTWATWSSRWNWVDRARLFDADVDRQVREKRAAQIVAAQDRHIRQSVAIQSAGSGLLKVFLESMPAMLPKLLSAASTQPKAFAELWHEIRAFALVLPHAVNIERSALGLPTESVNVDVVPPDMRFANAVAADPEATRLAIELLDRVAGTTTARESDAPPHPNWPPPPPSDRAVH
jgi:hypothetical protein